jgi:hypothetical protein
MTYRTLLQKVGTDALRGVIHENIWVNALFSDYRPAYFAGIDPAGDKPFKKEDVFVQNVDPKWLITDMRFPNELAAIKERGGITIRINRKWVSFETSFGEITEIRHIPGFDAPEHPSETALDSAEFDYVIDNNGSINDLIKKVETILKQENIIL